MRYQLAFLNWSSKDGEILITNEFGKYRYLMEEDFNAMINGDLVPDDDLYNDLLDEGFIYENKEAYLYRFQNQMLESKRCLLIGTQLLILVLTDACNQRCVYCQAGKAHARKTPVDVCKKAVDVAVQAPVSRMTIEFQGGEPTLNPEALYFTIPYAKQVFNARGKKVDFAIVTNLTDIDETLLEWLIKEDVHISTSLDGNASVHERNRPLANKASSYDAWHRGLDRYRALCARAGQTPTISAIQTTTRNSLLSAKAIVDEYLHNGMNHLYIRPLTPLGFAQERWREIGYSPKEYLRFYTEILDYMMALCKAGRQVFETTASLYLARILFGESLGHTEYRSPCGAAVGQIAVNYDGYIYTCDEGRMLANMGDPIFRLGSVDDTYIDLMRSPAARAVCTASCIEGLPFCSECVYMPYCSVCPVVNYGVEGDLISRNMHNYRCMISMGILNYLFSIIKRNDSQEMDILKRWAIE